MFPKHLTAVKDKTKKDLMEVSDNTARCFERCKTNPCPDAHLCRGLNTEETIQHYKKLAEQVEREHSIILDIEV